MEKKFFWKNIIMRSVSVIYCVCLPVLFLTGCKPVSNETENPSAVKEESDSTKTSASRNEAPETGKVDNTVVKTESGSLIGSGVIYGKKEDCLVLVTAAHVLEQEHEEVRVTFFDGFSTKSTAGYLSANADLAFLIVDISSIPPENQKKYQAVQVDKDVFDGIQSGEEVVFCAAEIDVEQEMSSTREAAVNEGIIRENWTFVEDFGQYMMLMQGDIQPGMSGGGVYDREGNFLGIICGANKDGDVVCVPLSIIMAEYAMAF